MSDPSTPTTVTIGKLTVELVDPPSLFALAACRTAAEHEGGGLSSDLAYGAAALRMCWPPKKAWPCKPRPQPWEVGRKVGPYGSDIWEALRAATKGTVAFRDLQTACIAALVFAVGSAMHEADIQAAVDFSEGQEE